jgi:hypothetical protein
MLISLREENQLIAWQFLARHPLQSSVRRPSKSLLDGVGCDQGTSEQSLSVGFLLSPEEHMNISDQRYQIRQEENGSWTVFDTTPLSRREDRMMTGLTEARAITYADKLNAALSKSGRRFENQPQKE